MWRVVAAAKPARRILPVARSTTQSKLFRLHSISSQQSLWTTTTLFSAKENGRREPTTNASSSMRGGARGLVLSPVALLVTTVAVLSFQPVPLCRADSFRLFSTSKKQEEEEAEQVPASETVFSSSSRKKQDTANDDDDCPFYGCALKPVDVHYNSEELKKALEDMRQDKREAVVNSPAARKLRTSATEEHVTLTLIGYKGGELNAQINQDRALIVAPYNIYPLPEQETKPSESNDENTAPPLEPPKQNNNNEKVDLSKDVQAFLKANRTLLGVFDGHAPLGERVSEFTATELPRVLAQKLTTKAITNASKSSSALSAQDEIDITKQSLTETFIELDKMAPAHPSGGCTATLILHQGDSIFIANAGDSRSFVVAYRPSTPNNVTVVYESREDKPNLPDERARVEKAGGQVYIPTRGTSRVVYHDPTTGAPTGLAMSRSIGDWEAGKMGVIPDPIVDVIDMQSVIAGVLLEDVGDETDADSYQVDPVGNLVDSGGVGPTPDLLGSSTTTKSKVGGVNDDVYLFAVSATDGMMDYLNATEISRVLAHALFDEAGAHPATAVEHLIFAAANAWQQNKQGRYRDDIAIAVSALRRPPTKNEAGPEQGIASPQ